MPHKLPMSLKHKEDRTSPGTGPNPEEPPSHIRKCGYLKKLKTMKKKYFILRAESQSGPARLEYYDSEKKYKSGAVPKRNIIIKKCFNINRKLDAKHKNAIALYTRDDCFAVVAETDTELEEWLTAMLELQQGTNDTEGDLKPKPKFEHVWQVTVKNKGMGSSKNITGSHRLCLTARCLTLVKMSPHTDKPDMLEFPLMSIRRCGHSDCFFFMELGRSAITGAGELWMQTEDVLIAQNMHEAILGAMKASRDHDDMGPIPRPRSASTSENSKPIVSRRPVAVVSPHVMGPFSVTRERCDSMPSRPRTISEGQERERGQYTALHYLDFLRPQSSYGRTMSYSPPTTSNPVSPSSVACSIDSTGSSLSIDEFEMQNDFPHRYSHSLPTEGAVHTEPPIKEEPVDDYLLMSLSHESKEVQEYMPMAPLYSTSAPSTFLNQVTTDVLSKGFFPYSDRDYMEMSSPTSPSEGFMPLIPVDSGNTDTVPSTTNPPHKLGSCTEQTTLKEVCDGYVPMAPLQDNITNPPLQYEGYMDMTPLSSSLPKIPAQRSMCVDVASLRSSHNLPDLPTGTSPTLQKEEFHLEKVKSYFSPSEDESDDYIKPVRTYSIGSRPQVHKTHLSVHSEQSRVRAYSVGSQATPSTLGGKDSIELQLGSLKNIDFKASKKSFSAPQLPSKPSRAWSSAGRSDHREDLMEIDYDKSSHETGNKILNIGNNRQHTLNFSSIMCPVTETKQRTGISYVLTEPSQAKADNSCYTQMSFHKNGSAAATDSRKNKESLSSSRKALANSIAAQKNIYPAGDYVTLDPSSSKPLASDISQSTANSSHTVSKSSLLQTQNTSQTPNLKSAQPTGNSALNTENLMLSELSTKPFQDYMCMEIKPVKRDGEPPSNCTTEVPTQAVCKATLPQKLIHTDANLHAPSTHANINPLPFKATTSQSSSPTTSGHISLPPKPETLSTTQSLLHMIPACASESSAVPRRITDSPSTPSLPTLTSPYVPNIIQGTKGVVGSHSAPSSRPSSIISHQELNYASLDLVTNESNPPDSLKEQHLGAETEEKEISLTYAEIDFAPSRLAA